MHARTHARTHTRTRAHARTPLAMSKITKIVSILFLLYALQLYAYTSLSITAVQRCPSGVQLRYSLFVLCLMYELQLYVF